MSSILFELKEHISSVISKDIMVDFGIQTGLGQDIRRYIGTNAGCDLNRIEIWNSSAYLLDISSNNLMVTISHAGADYAAKFSILDDNLLPNSIRLFMLIKKAHRQMGFFLLNQFEIYNTKLSSSSIRAGFEGLGASALTIFPFGSTKMNRGIPSMA